jgi:hypothetical protein
MGDRVKGPAGDPATLIRTSKGSNATHDLARGATSERQEQDALRCDAALEENIHPRRERRRLSGAGSRYDAKGRVPE